ncbi:MAG: CDP-alcohol phosphatidyltransferase family protein [Candidatus Saccharibacteria bacterium]
MKKLPFLLIWSRILIALAIVMVALARLPQAPVMIVSLMSAGLITDILDGIIARKLGVATQRLRVWDSNVDQFFWLTILACIFAQHASFIKSHYLPIVAIAGLEVLAHLFSFLKFRRTVATHSWLAKLWTLTLFAFLADLSLHGQSNFWLKLCAVLGIVSRLEILLILFLLKEWTTDVASVLMVKRVNSRRN